MLLLSMAAAAPATAISAVALGIVAATMNQIKKMLPSELPGDWVAVVARKLHSRLREQCVGRSLGGKPQRKGLGAALVALARRNAEARVARLATTRHLQRARRERRLHTEGERRGLGGGLVRCEGL